MRTAYKGRPVPSYLWQRTGADFVLIDCNDAARKTMGGKTAAHIGAKAKEFWADAPGIIADMANCLIKHDALRREIRCGSRGIGEKKELAVYCAFVPPDLVIVNTEDVTESKHAQRSVRHMAYHDSLTGLPNRRLFNDHLEQALAVAGRKKQMLALLFIDLDQFKRINDAWGHEFGDLLLRALARRLKSGLRRVDTAARFGGDEFIIMLTDIKKSGDAAMLTVKILDRIAKPLNLDGHRMHISAAVGISLYPADGTDARTLQNHADAALLRAKERGPNVYQFYTPEMHVNALARMATENDLRRSLDRGELVLYYQPCVDIDSARIIGAEALLRWRRPAGGLVQPIDFVSIAEETGLIVPIGDWVIRTAAAQNKVWLDAGLGPLRMMVNLSARQFHERGLAETVSKALEEVGLDPAYLALEITESLIMKNAGETAAVLYELKEMGVDILMDDFGVGYSSLGSLKFFPIDALKIDRSFVRDAIDSPDDAAIVRAMILIAQSLKMSVIAEGVETEAQLAFLKSLKCEAMQGYIFSRPVPAAEFELLLEGQRPFIPGVFRAAGL